MRKFFAFACLLVAFFAADRAQAASFQAGDLVKLPDDGNPATTADSSVYYYGEGGKRYVFPNSAAYFTWYADFSSVKSIGAADMASLPLGGNVTYRPGLKMIKISSDPKVYAVSKGGVLRPIGSESVAAALYGADWNKKIDDVPDAFFVNYSIGAAVNAATEYDKNAEITAVPNIGSNLASAPSSAPAVPTFSLKTLSSTTAASDADATLLVLRFQTPKAVMIRKLPIRLEALRNTSTGTPDVDDGGLVFQNASGLNLSNVRFLDENGITVFGAIDPVADVVKDQDQILEFGGGLAVAAGADKTFILKARTAKFIPAGEPYRATLLTSRIELTDNQTGLPAAYSPSADLAGETVTVQKNTFAVSLSSKPGNVTAVRGAKNVELAGFDLSASSLAANVVKAISFQGYIDEQEGGPGFLAGSDADNGSGTLFRDVIPAVSLYDDHGTLLAGPVDVSLSGRASFAGLSFSIPAGERRTVILKGDVSKTVDIESTPNLLAFDIVDAAKDVTVVDAAGAPVESTGAAPNGGVTPKTYATIKKSGTATIAWSGQSGIAVGGREIDLGTLKIVAKDDAFELKAVTFRTNGSNNVSLGDFRLEYDRADGTRASVVAPFVGSTAVFTGLSAAIKKDAGATVRVLAGILPKNEGGKSGESVQVRLGLADVFQMTASTSGDVIDETSLGSSDFPLTNTATAMTVRYTVLTAAKASSSPEGEIGRGSETPVLRFTLAAEPEGGARIQRLTFKLTPSDAATSGSDNDALEKWADINGDFWDDNAVVNLRREVGTAAEVLGEGAEANIRYSIVKGGVKDATPQGLDSAAGDYGLIEYVFGEGGELLVAAGSTATFRLELDTNQFAPGSKTLKAELLGADDFGWIDTVTGFFDPLSGLTASGLPIASPTMSVS